MKQVLAKYFKKDDIKIERLNYEKNKINIINFYDNRNSFRR